MQVTQTRVMTPNDPSFLLKGSKHRDTDLRVLDGLSSSSRGFEEKLLLCSGVDLQQFTCNMLKKLIGCKEREKGRGLCKQREPHFISKKQGFKRFINFRVNIKGIQKGSN